MAKRRWRDGGVDDDGAANWHRDALLMHPSDHSIRPRARGTRVSTSDAAYRDDLLSDMSVYENTKLN